MTIMVLFSAGQRETLLHPAKFRKSMRGLRLKEAGPTAVRSLTTHQPFSSSRSVISQQMTHNRTAASSTTSSIGPGLAPLPRDISSPSFGHLVSSLSATTPQMIADGSRREGHTMEESQRTFARRVTLGLVGVPVVFAVGVVLWDVSGWGEEEEAGSG